MIPGGIHPLVMGNELDPLDELGVIGHSLRFNVADSAYLTRTPAASGNRKTWTWGGWIKRSALGSIQDFWNSANAGGTVRGLFRFNAADQLYLQLDAATASLTTTAVYRDIASHLHVHLAVDTTQAVAADRLKLWINGAQVTAGTFNYPALNADTEFNIGGQAHTLSGSQPYTSEYFGGYLSNVYFIDGQALAPTAFGAFHPRTNQWRPKAYAGTYGANGFLLDFSDGSAATSSALGKDRSGNNNDWTPVNISVAAGAGCDWQTDTPTNNFCTLNSLDPAVSPFTIANGGLELNANGSVVALTRRGTFPMTSGKWYWECAQTASANDANRFGIVKDGASLASASEVGADSYGWGYQGSNGNKINAGSSVAYGAMWTTNDVIGVLFDADAGTLTFYKNGASQGVAYSGLTNGPYYPAVSSNSTTTVLVTNFGQRGLSYPVSSAKAPGTKNLPYPSIPKSSSAFVAVTDSGANVAATLAAARPGWTDYIEIFKRRDATAEGWRWRFSSDLANYLDSSSTAAKAAFPALAGTSYVAYALKVAAANGVATGTFAHTNGVADTITDGLSNTRKMIILKREDAASSWFVYHPDLTAGRLLYLEQAVVEAIDATISTVLASSFVAAAALPSGTYRWMALAEIDGLIELTKSTGNGSADGPFDYSGETPELALRKGKDISSSWHVFDLARNPSNVNADLLYFDVASGTSTDTLNQIDTLSNGIKMRGTHNYTNGSGLNYVGLQIAAYPFRYANAR